MFFRSMLKILDDLDSEQRVLVRLDLNSPVEDGKVQDNRRFGHHTGTVREPAEVGCRVVPMTYQGRPGGGDLVSLRQRADILTPCIDHEAGFIADTYSDNIIAAIGTFETGDVLLLENMRMCDERLPEEDPEVKANTEFVRIPAEYVDAYVNDACSAVYRSYASLVGFPLAFPAYTDRVMQTEYEANSSIATCGLDGQVTIVVDGTKVADVIDITNNLGDKVDQLLSDDITGELFLRAVGDNVDFDLGGMDSLDNQWEASHETIELLPNRCGDQTKFTVNLACKDETDNRGKTAVASIIEKSRAYLDVGSMMVDEYGPIIRNSEAISMKGAFGLPEDGRFAVGTTGVLRAIAETDCFSIADGDDTFRAIGTYGMDEADFGHISTADGAYIHALIDVPLAGVEVLKQD